MGNLTAECPPVGIYPGIPFEEYCQWDAINHSKLSRIDKSPLHAKTPIDLSESRSIRFGQLVHCGQLEFDSIVQRYAVMPDYHLMPENTTGKGEPSTSAATSFVKGRRAWFMEQIAGDGRSIASMDEFKQMDDTLMAILQCKPAVECLTDGQPELSIVWKDKYSGLRCKARIDYKRHDRLTDLKTSRDDRNDPLPESFAWSLWKFSYYSQAAWYQDGWFQLTGEKLPFWFAVVTNSYPIQCIAAPVGEVSLSVGRQKNLERIKKWMICVSFNQWPGYQSPPLFELPDKYLEIDVE